MKIIYNCYGGAHSSVVAAALHLGLLDNTRVPGEKELLELPLFDGTWEHDHGRLFFFGIDDKQREIYVLGKRNLGHQLNDLIHLAAQAAGITREEYLLVDALPYVNWLMVVGGYTSRRLHWERLGRPIVIRGIQTFYWQIVNKVEQVKKLVPITETKKWVLKNRANITVDQVLACRVVRSFWLAWGITGISLDFLAAMVNNE